jgi:PAS domain S-box-containing protein
MTQTPRVLIVDDERLNRQLLSVMLEPEGFHLLNAASGKEALAMVADQGADLVLLDIVMPVMDGYQVTAELKGNAATKNIPIIMITDLNDRNARLLGLKAGAEDFLSKPLDRAELCVRVRNLLRLKSYGDYHDTYSQLLEREVGLRTADLRFERDRAQRYLDTAAVIMLALDTDGRVTLANRYACSVLGWTAEEMLGRDWIEMCIPARLRPEMRAGYAEALTGKLPIHENPIITRTGEERLFEWRNTVLRDDAGALTGTFSSGTDITERTKAVQALSSAEERMRFALDSANVGIWDMDYVSGVLRWSESLERQYGLTPGTFAGTMGAFDERVHPDDREGLHAVLALAMKSGADFTTENRSLAPDGTVRWLNGAGRIHLGAQGQPLRGVGISQDVTRSRSLEQQYRQAQKMEAVGQLASGVAHDFNNLLTVILSYAELMMDDPAITRDHREEILEISSAARSAAGLTKQLLAFGRQQVLRAAPLDVNVLITDITGMLARLIGENIAVALALAPKLPLALADRGQLEQVIVNLVVNARDAMPAGGTLTIETSEAELPNSAFNEPGLVHGRYVTLAIADTGTGMSKAIQDQVFEPFFTTKEIGKGTGLGLSTTYGIVKQSKGYIWLYSELGHGTTFKVFLPCASQADPRAQSQAATTPRSIGGSETLLLLEDEATVRRLSKRILERAGYRVHDAATGDEAWSLFAEHGQTITLLITDMIMPGNSGPEMFSRLQARDPSLRVLYMSGYTEQSLAHAAGIDAGRPFMQKPFTATELLQHVRNALDR